MSDDTYNGFKNKPTWAWKRWIDDNEDGWYTAWKERTAEILSEAEAKKYLTAEQVAVAALAEALEEEAHDMVAEVGIDTGPLSELLAWAVTMVEWKEIAQALIDEATG